SETLQYIDDKFQVEPWGAMELRGKKQLVDVYRVISHRADTAAIASSSPAAAGTTPPVPNSGQLLDPANGQINGQTSGQINGQPLAQSATQSLNEWERKKSTADLETKENSLNLWE
ncbi:MAG TPA: hypothetical protein V6C88_04200, partial [Chroococcidiopsis sp.]